MIEFERFFRRLMMLILMSVVVAIGFTLLTIWIAFTIAEIEFGMSVTLGALIGAGIGYALASWLTSIATQPVKFIQQTLNVTMHDVPDVALPKPEQLVAGQEVTRHILKDIYDLTSSQHESQKKASESTELLSALIDQLGTAVIAIDRNRLVTYANPVARDLLLQPTQAYKKLPLDKAFHLEFPSENTLYAWLEASENNAVHATESWQRVKLTDGTGNERYFDVVAHFIKSESHGLETILALSEFTETYASDSREVSFVSLAVHELRSLVTILRGYIEVFEDEIGPTMDDEHQSFMRKMNVTAAQLSTFVNNILNVSRLDNEQMKVHMQEADWRELIEDIGGDMRLRAEVRGRHFSLEVPDNLPHVAVDRVSIYEVMSNLVDNAVKYSPDGGEIRVRVSLSANGFVETTVSDDGIGVPANLMPHLFDKFYRSHRSRENIGGTGLGLYLSKKIVEAHGGSIWCESKEDQGATFGFTLQKFEDVKDELGNDGSIVRSAHGWIMNHEKVRR